MQVQVRQLGQAQGHEWESRVSAGVEIRTYTSPRAGRAPKTSAIARVGTGANTIAGAKAQREPTCIRACACADADAHNGNKVPRTYCVTGCDKRPHLLSTGPRPENAYTQLKCPARHTYYNCSNSKRRVISDVTYCQSYQIAVLAIRPDYP